MLTGRQQGQQPLEMTEFPAVPTKSNYVSHFFLNSSRQSIIPLLRWEGGRNGKGFRFVAVPPKLDLESVSDTKKKGKSSLSSGQSIEPTAFFLRSWEHEDLVLFLEAVGEIEEFGFLGDECGLAIGCLRELCLEIRDLVLE